MQVPYEKYILVVALVHEGPKPDTGHYRAVLVDDKLRLIMHDAVPAKRLQPPAEFARCCKNYSAFLYVRCPNP